MTRVSKVAVALAVLLTSSGGGGHAVDLLAQAPHAAFRAGVELVALSVTVRSTDAPICRGSQPR